MKYEILHVKVKVKLTVWFFVASWDFPRTFLCQNVKIQTLVENENFSEYTWSPSYEETASVWLKWLTKDKMPSSSVCSMSTNEEIA